MTAFDRAWRRSREDSMIDPLQQAYDKTDGYENVQHFIHVADPIETFMPNSDKPQKMFREHLEPTNLVNDEGKYLDSEESWRNMQDDIANLARPRKDRKKSKYARIFVPNPESKKDKIGDFHLDESKSEEWQEKLAGETMTAFDRAWALLKFEDWESEGDPFAPPPPEKPPVNPTEHLANEIGLEYPIVHIEPDPNGFFIGYQCGDYATTGQLFGGLKGNASFINEMFGQRHLQRCEQCQSALHDPQNINLSHRQRRNLE